MGFWVFGVEVAEGAEGGEVVKGLRLRGLLGLIELWGLRGLLGLRELWGLRRLWGVRELWGLRGLLGRREL